MTEKKYLKRFRIFIIVTAIILGIIIWQYMSLMIFRGDETGSAVRSTPIVERGPILDRNGKILAVQTRLYSVTAWTPNIEDFETTARTLGDLLQLDSTELREKLEAADGFLYIKRKISPRETREFELVKNQGLLPGISLEAEFGRNYPEKDLAAHVLGYVGTDNIGLNGIEYTFDSELSPMPVDGGTDTVFGNQVFLTLDLNIQYFAEEIARNAYKENLADSVMLLVAEADTGDILAYVSLPSFDPNTFYRYTTSDRENRPVSFAYEPGSVFKAFSISSFLELKAVDFQDTFVCNGYYDIEIPNGETERINCLGVHGVVNPQLILQYSCNAGAAYASEQVDQYAFYDMLKAFGFGSPIGLPFTGESHGILREPQQWSIRSKPTLAMGQEISVSAVQMVSAATALANDGVLLKTNIVKKIVSPDGRLIQEFGREPVRRLLSKGTADAVLRMMESATSAGGTARRSFVEGIRTSAKTGTAQMLDPQTGKYSEEAYVASCLAVLPTDDPELIVYVVIENPKGGEHFGGRIAAPVVREVTEALLPYLDIPRENELVIDHSGTVEVPARQMPPMETSVPDFTGFSKREILPLLSRDDINVLLSGEGWVVRQDPSPGTPLTPGLTLRLEFE